MTEPNFSQVFQGLKIVLAEESQLAELKGLIEAMYDHFFEANGTTQLPENGFKNWMVGYGRSRSVSRTIFICYDGDKCIGMIEGQIKIGGAMSGLGKLGHIAHLYVAPDYRKIGLASELLRIQEDWFSGKKIDNVTLDVVCGNSVASAFWASVGFTPSFVNMVKPASKN